MYKIVTMLSYLLLPSFLAFSAEGPAIDVAKLLEQKQEEHRDFIRKKGNLFDLYEKNLQTLSQCTGTGDSLLNGVLGQLQHEQEQLAKEIATFEQRQYGLYSTHEIIPLLTAQAVLIKDGLQFSKSNPEVELKIKIAADCLSRLMVQEFHSHTLDWTQDPLVREKNAKEKQDQSADLDSSKNHIVKERNCAKALVGWIGVISSPYAAFFACLAIKKPSVITGGIAAIVAGWTGYHGYHYYRLKSLPYPSNDDVYKHWAITLKPKF